MLLPVLLLGASVLGNVVMVGFATHDPGFSLVPDYYQKASNFEAELEQRRVNQRLGFGLSVERFGATDVGGENGELELVVRYTNNVGEPLLGAAIDVTAFPIARADRRTSVRLEPSLDVPGRYSAKLRASRPGLWELGFDARSKEGRFTSITRASVGVRGPAP